VNRMENEGMEPQLEATANHHAPNWMLMVVCLVATITAGWEALHARGNTLDLIGFLSLSAGMLLFAVEAVVNDPRLLWVERMQIPAVLLTILGVILLCLSI